jgi:hypothetical protein
MNTIQQTDDSEPVVCYDIELPARTKVQPTNICWKDTCRYAGYNDLRPLQLERMIKNGLYSSTISDAYVMIMLYNVIQQNHEISSHCFFV